MHIIHSSVVVVEYRSASTTCEICGLVLGSLSWVVSDGVSIVSALNVSVVSSIHDLPYPDIAYLQMSFILFHCDFFYLVKCVIINVLQ